MATISRLFGFRHLRSAPNSYICFYKRGRLRAQGRGLAFWFHPLSASVAEIPCDDQDESFLFRARTSDFQDVAVQGHVTYRVADPAVVADRIDFSIDLSSGRYAANPLPQLSQLLVNVAQQHGRHYLAATDLRQSIAEGIEEIRGRVHAGLVRDANIQSLGIQIVSVRLSEVNPSEDLERALEAPAYEAVQQEADEAAFARRALAVEKERAIQENELQSKIELARREEQLIAQNGQNERNRASELSMAARIDAEGAAERTRLGSAAEADRINVVEEARVTAERERMAIYADLPSHVLIGMAFQEFAAKLKTIEHLHLTPEMLGPMVSDLLRGVKRVGAGTAGNGS